MKISFLAKKRTEQGLFVQEVAQKLGVSAEEVRRWEEEGELPDSQYLLPLADLYGVSVEEILRAAEDEAPPAAESAEAAEKTVSAAESEDVPALAESRAAESAPAAEGRATPAEKSANAAESSAAENMPASESYYRKLNKKLAEKYPSGSIPAEEDSLYRNGYIRAERIFGYIIGAVFLLVLLVELFVWLGRERDITAENYRDFLSIDVRATESFNPDDYALYVTAERDLLNISVTVRVRFSEIGGFFGGGAEEFERTVTLSYGALEKNESAFTEFHLNTVAMERGFEVISVSGRAA